MNELQEFMRKVEKFADADKMLSGTITGDDHFNRRDIESYRTRCRAELHNYLLDNSQKISQQWKDLKNGNR